MGTVRETDGAGRTRRFFFNTAREEPTLPMLVGVRLRCSECVGFDLRALHRCPFCGGFGYVLVPIGRSAEIVARQRRVGALP
jgi:hypothetical protein